MIIIPSSTRVSANICIHTQNARIIRSIRAAKIQNKNFTYYRVSIADLLVILVEDGLEPQLGRGPGADVHSVLEAQGAVVVGEEVADGGVIPADNDGVRLNLIWDGALCCQDLINP